MNECLSTVEFAHLISASLLRLRTKSPFFGTLAMFARFISSENIPSAATDGRDVFLNPEFLSSLSTQQQDGLLLHEILHAALLHPLRGQERDPWLWNIAADIVVNGTICRHPGLELPPGGLRDEKLEQYSVEEVYELLRSTPDRHWQLAHPDLLTPKIKDSNICATSGMGEYVDLTLAQTLTAHWQHAIQQAQMVAKSAKYGKFAQGLERELAAVIDPQLDWRIYLWRYLVQTPTDFQGFDRRFIGRGIYLEALQCESLRIYLAIDTSSSISDDLLQIFIGEVRGILSAYPHLECDLYYTDSDLYGPYRLAVDLDLPIPEGGGGSCFVPFFDRVTAECDVRTQAVCIYLTDGYGEFPTHAPAIPTLWIVTPGGLALDAFPFGEAIRLLDRN
jgi:predicted metal-dependent peptidase